VAPNALSRSDVLLRNYSLTRPLLHPLKGRCGGDMSLYSETKFSSLKAVVFNY